MKRFLSLLCCLLPLMTVACATVPGGAPPAEKLHGTWANREYFGTQWVHTFVLFPDGTSLWNQGTSVDTPTGEARYAVDKSWVDSEGNTWYLVTEKWCYGAYNEAAASAMKTYWRLKLNPAGDTMDFEASTRTWPDAFGALGSHHFVYFRQ